MDIKLRAKNSINKRMMWGIVSVLLITFSITVLIFSFVSKQFVINQTKDDLEQAANVLEENFFQTIKRNQDNEAVTRLSMAKLISNIEVFNRFMKMTTIVLNEEGEVLFPKTGWDKEKVALTLRRINLRNTEYIVYEHTLKDRFYTNETEEVFRKLILLKKYDDVKSLRNIGVRAFVISFSIGLVIAILISAAISKRLTKPIIRLERDMNNYLISKTPVTVYPSNDEIEALSIKFKQLTDKISSLDERQKQFFQNSSHELKTPLMSIQGYVEAIKDGIVEGDELDHSLDIIISETQRLKNIVDDVIYLSKIDSLEDEFVLKNHCLRDIIKDAMLVTKPLLEVNKINIEVNCLEEVSLNCDYEKMKRVFINLIGNGTRYAKTKIIINVHTHDNGLIIDVIDDGNGFDFGQEEKVFDRFYNGKNGGSGIGLSLTKEIIERHGGTIQAINNMNYGAIFKITF